MAVLISTDVRGQTQEGYDEVSMVLHELVKKAPGFILHTSHRIDGGWRVIEVWESKADADAFFSKVVRPNLPPGIHPKRSYQELHSLVRI